VQVAATEPTPEAAGEIDSEPLDQLLSVPGTLATVLLLLDEPTPDWRARGPPGGFSQRAGESGRIGLLPRDHDVRTLVAHLAHYRDEAGAPKRWVPGATLVSLAVEQDGPALTLRVRVRERETSAAVDVSIEW